jgi:hypothetical protein
MATKKDKIYVHGVVYKAFKPDQSNYDGLLLTEADCKKIVADFYSQSGAEGGPKGKKQTIYVSLNHSASAKKIVGKIEDLYYDPRDSKLKVVYQLIKTSMAHSDAKEIISRKDPIGLSVELNFGYDGLGPDRSMTPTTKVSNKQLIGLSMVKTPDHHQDGTYITGWVKGDNPADLFAYVPEMKSYVDYLKANEKPDNTDPFYQRYVLGVKNKGQQIKPMDVDIVSPENQQKEPKEAKENGEGISKSFVFFQIIFIS